MTGPGLPEKGFDSTASAETTRAGGVTWTRTRRLKSTYNVCSVSHMLPAKERANPNPPRPPAPSVSRRGLYPQRKSRPPPPESPAKYRLTYLSLYLLAVYQRLRISLVLPEFWPSVPRDIGDIGRLYGVGLLPPSRVLPQIKFVSS